MKKVIFIIISLVLINSGNVFAKPNFVKGAKCTECHNPGKFTKENLKPTALAMNAKTKDASNKEFNGKKCSDCHAVNKGKLTVKGK